MGKGDIGGSIAQRRVQGTDQHRRATTGRPVSGKVPCVPRQVPGARWVGNASMDARGFLAAATCVMVVGGGLASTAATIGAPTAGARGAGPAGAGDTLSGLVNLPPGSTPGTVGAWRPGTLRDAAPVQAAPTGLRPFTVPPPRAAMLEPLPERGWNEGGWMDLAGAWLSAWYADPCVDFDTYVNGFWKLAHPPARTIPSRLRELDRTLEDRLSRRLSLLPSLPALSPAGRLLAGIWASALHPRSRSWQAFAPQAGAIAALSTRSDVEAHLCSGLGEGRDAIMEFRSLFGVGELDADAALLPQHERAVYTAAPDDPGVIAYLRQVKALLTHAGMSSSEAEARAPILLRMEARLAAAAEQLEKVDLASAQSAVPGFPWRQAWNALGLDPAQQLYAGLERCRTLEQLLAEHDVADWKAWLLYQEARDAQPFIEHDSTPRALLRQLDHERLGQDALSAWYMEDFDQERVQRARRMFEGIRQQYRQDVASSALPDGDRQRIDAVLAATQLRIASRGQVGAWAGPPATATFLQHVQALRRIHQQAGIHRLTTHAAADAVSLPAHRFFMANGLDYNAVFASPALLDILHEASAGNAEAEWATLGVMLGHELGHALANVEQLSAQGAAIMAQRNAEIGQRIGDIEVAGARLEVPRVLEEVACDFRGLSAARRAGRAEALAAGNAFDDRRFFEAAARLHAANPAPAQLREGLPVDDHPPPQVRVALVAQAKGFEAAFDCPPGPSRPFDTVV